MSQAEVGRTQTAEAPAIEWPGVIEDLLAGRSLSEDRAAAVLREVMAGRAESAQIAALLTALRAKGESAGEIAGFVRAMMDAAAPIDVPGMLVDTCGTGGDGTDTFNISTVSALVVAATGVPVAKHGNRAASSLCGSADVLEAWGVAIDLPAQAVADTIEELGIGFLYARTFHPAMRHVAPVRGAMGISTVFNVLGPLSNPADASHQIVGAADARLAPVMAQALARLGKRALVFRGDDGLDELSVTGPSRIWEVEDGEVAERVFEPSSVGLEPAGLDALKGGTVEDNVRIADAVLEGRPGPTQDIVALNAGAALWVAGAADDLADGLRQAREVLASGAAGRLRDRWVERSQAHAQA